MVLKLVLVPVALSNPGHGQYSRSWRQEYANGSKNVEGECSSFHDTCGGRFLTARVAKQDCKARSGSMGIYNKNANFWKHLPSIAAVREVTLLPAFQSFVPQSGLLSPV